MNFMTFSSLYSKSTLLLSALKKATFRVFLLLLFPFVFTYIFLTWSLIPECISRMEIRPFSYIYERQLLWLWVLGLMFKVHVYLESDKGSLMLIDIEFLGLMNEIKSKHWNSELVTFPELCPWIILHCLKCDVAVTGGGRELN